MYLIGDVSAEDRQHVENCEQCQTRVAALTSTLGHFRGAVRNWSEVASPKDRAAELRWTVIPSSDHLDHLLLPASTTPWYRMLWSNLKDVLTPQKPPLDITSKPVLVRNIWGQYGHQKKSWAMSFAFQCSIVALLVLAGTNKTVQQKVVAFIPLIDPVMSPPDMPPKAQTMHGGGGGGDGSTQPATRGRLPKPALRQFTPPVAVANNLNPKLTMEATIIAPPDTVLPNVNMAQYGDPLAKLGPASNGPGSGGGIGSGKDGGVGSGKGGGYGTGNDGGVGGGVYRAGGGVSKPELLAKVEPEYSEEARKAKYQGTVLLYVEVDPMGRATNIRVSKSLGLGLDEKAIEAVKKWKFRPGYKDGKPVTVAATIEVNFRLL
jgi:TonB family protein